MKKKALISVKSIQNNDKNEAIEVVTPGDFYKKDDNYYVRYEETEISGMEGTTTTMKITSDSITLTRKGTTNSKMTFKKNAKDIVMYGTPHGILEFMLDTKKIDINLNDEGGNIAATYNMFLGEGEPLKTSLNVEIKPQDQEWQ